MFAWWRRRRRRRLLATPPPGDWPAILDRDVAVWRGLDDDERRRLFEITRVLVAEKSWEGCGGLALTEAMCVALAAQAGLLLLNLRHDYYANVDSVLVYPDTYVLPGAPASLDGEPRDRRPVLGTAHHGGPVVLSWRSALHGGRDARDGRNLVFHEFAHKLDMADGLVDGTPPLAGRGQLADWVKVMTREYADLRRRAARGRSSFLDHYGATNVAEFFAVATEHFFEQPRQMRRRHPALYGVLRGYYQQDPAARSTGARAGRSRHAG